MEGAFQAPTSSTVNTAFGSTTATATPNISAVRTRTAEPDGMDLNDNMIMETDTTMLQTTTPWTRSSEPGEDLSLSSCVQESGTARTSSSSVPLVSSLPPSANTPSFPSSSRPLSYAQITNRTTSPLTSTSPPSSSAPFKVTETRRQRRTQILRRTAYGTTTKDILQTVTAQMGIPEEQHFECVIRDQDDHRRFYVTYRTQQMKMHTTGKGYYIGDLHIRPTDDYLTGYIPHPPYYIDRQTLDHLLSSYGTIKEASFVTTPRNTRIGGYKFELQLKADVGRPTCLRYRGKDMEIRYQDDVKQCVFCKRYGHIISACRKKKAADAERLHTTTLQKEEEHQVWMTNHRLLRTEMEDALLLLQTDYATASRVLESVFSSMRTDLCVNKASDAQLHLWGSICEAESDSIREGFEMEVNSLQQTCTDRQTVINDEYTTQGGTLDNLPPSVFNDTTNLVNVRLPADSVPDDPVAHEALLFDLRQRYESKVNLLRSVPDQPPPMQDTTNVSHLHQVALNPDALRIAAEQKERDRLLAEKERAAAQRRDEQHHKEQHRLQAKQIQKEKARQAAALRKQKVDKEEATQEMAEEECHQEMEAKDVDTEGSESAAELHAHRHLEIPPFCRMEKHIQATLLQRYNELLPKNFNKQHCPSYIRLVATFKNISTRLRDELIDTQLATPKPKVNPQDLIYDVNGDINEIWVRTPETLQVVLNVLKRLSRHVHFQDGPHVLTNKNYDPAKAGT